MYVLGEVFTTYVIDPSTNIKSDMATTYFLVEIYRNKDNEGDWYLRPTDEYVYKNAD